MNFGEAKTLIEKEVMEGIAYTTRYGEYPDENQVNLILDALTTIHGVIKGNVEIERKLAANLFVLNDQVQRNMYSAKETGILGAQEFEEKYFFEIRDILLAIFEDH